MTTKTTPNGDYGQYQIQFASERGTLYACREFNGKLMQVIRYADLQNLHYVIYLHGVEVASFRAK